VLTTPVIRCLKQQLPSVEIHYLTKPQYATILEASPHISHVHVLDKPLLKKISELKKYNFDVIIDLHRNLRSFILKVILGVPAHSFNKVNFKKWLLVEFKWNILPNTHIVDRYLGTIKPLGVVNDGKGLEYFIPSNIDISDFTLPKEFVAFAIGAQHYTKRLPAPKIVEIANKLELPIVMLGGKEDIKQSIEIEKISTATIVNYCGKLTLHQSAIVLSRANKVISHDTGLMHIAAAFKKEIVSIWGNTIPEFGMTPYYGNEIVENTLFSVPHLRCKPCSKIGFSKCPKGHFKCMQLQDASAIALAVNE